MVMLSINMERMSNMKKILTAVLPISLLASLFCMGTAAADVPGIDDADLTPTKTVAGPIEIKSAGGVGWEDNNIYIQLDEKEYEAYDPYLTISYDLKINDQGSWAQLSMFLDSRDCNAWGGYQIRLEGGDAAYGNTGNAIDADYALTLYKCADNGYTYITGVELEAPDTNKDYRMIIQRVIGEQNTTLKVWFFEKASSIPIEPTLSYEVSSAVYGDASAGARFVTWDRVNAVASNLKLYGFEVAVMEETEAEAPPTVFEPGPIEIKSGSNQEWGEGVMYIPQQQVDWYKGAFTAEYTLSLKEIGDWGQLSLYIDSWNCNDWGGFMFRIEGGDAAYSNSEGQVEGECGLSLYRAGKPGWKFTTGKDIEPLDPDTLYRIAVQREVGEENTTLNIWFFEDGKSIPAEPSLTVTESNESAEGASAGIKFSTWDIVDAVVTNLHVYNEIFDEVIPDYEPSGTTSSPTTSGPETGVKTAMVPAVALLVGAGILLVCCWKKDKSHQG